MVIDGLEVQVRQLEHYRDDLLDEKSKLEVLKNELAEKVKEME